MKVQAEVTINANIDQVFSTFSDLESIEKIISEILEFEVLNGPTKMEVGTKWKETRKVFGKEATETMWVSEFNKNSNYVVLADSHGTKYRSEYTFSNISEKTIVKMSFTGTPYTFGAKLMGFMAFIFSNSLKKLLEKDMTELKNYCENQEINKSI